MKVIVCDLDGSLMPNSAGLYVSEPVKEKLIELQKKGCLIILNSARIFQGVYPLARQIKMDEFGGYVISCNGCHAYNMKTQKVEFSYPIEHDQVKWLWDYAQKYKMGMAFTQPDYAVCNRMKLGFELDQKNCDLDYIVTNHRDAYLKQEVVKCTLADDPEILEAHYDEVKEELLRKTDLIVIQSTPELYDIISRQASKHTAVERILEKENVTWEETSVIGDSYGDVESIRLCGFGCTLENGKPECKEVADLIVPSCFEEGCAVWLDQLLEMVNENH